MVYQTEREKKEFEEQVQFYVNELQKADKQMSVQDAIRKAKEAISNINMAYVLADVCNTFLNDAESTLKQMKMKLAGEDKHRFLLMQKAVKQARVMTSAFARPLYQMKDTDDACDCSDWYYHFLRLIETRVTDPRKTGMLIEFLLTMPQEENVYDESLDNFT